MVQITCDECGAVIFSWKTGDKTEKPAESDVFNRHVCRICKPKYERVDKELLEWSNGEYERLAAARSKKLDELRKKHFGEIK